MVYIAHQVSVEIIHISAPLSAPVTFPGIGVTMESSVEKIERLVGKNDTAVLTLPLTGQVGRGRGAGHVFLIER